MCAIFKLLEFFDEVDGCPLSWVQLGRSHCKRGCRTGRFGGGDAGLIFHRVLQTPSEGVQRSETQMIPDRFAARSEGTILKALPSLTKQGPWWHSQSLVEKTPHKPRWAHCRACSVQGHVQHVKKWQTEMPSQEQEGVGHLRRARTERVCSLVSFSGRPAVCEGKLRRSCVCGDSLTD